MGSVIATTSRAGMRVLVALASFGAVAAVGDTFASADDVLQVGQLKLATTQDPRTEQHGWALTMHGVAEKLFTLNSDGEIVPEVAQSVGKVSEFEWDVDLKPDYKWSDGTPVTAQDVAACLNELHTMNDNTQSSLGDITATVPCDGTVRIKSTKATHIMDAVLADWVFVVYKKVQPFANSNDFVFTGPYKIDTFAADHIDLVPNTYYPQHAERRPITVTKYADGDALAADAANLDIAFNLPVSTLDTLRATTGVNVRSFGVSQVYMMFYNMKKTTSPVYDLKVRQAIDLALNREELQQDLSGGHGTRSLFPQNTPYYQDNLGSSLADATAAGALLDDAGWTLDGTTNKRTKDGADLTIDLVAYKFRPDLGVMQPEIASNLEALGITVNVIMTRDGNYDNTGYDDDWTEVVNRVAAGDFDILMWSQNVLPTGDPAHFLNAFFHTDGGNNKYTGGWSSAAVDAKLDDLNVAEGHTARVAATAEAHAAILAEQPVSHLVTPSWHYSLSDRMVTEGYTAYGADYYIIHAEMFVTPTPAPAPVAHRGCLSTDGAGATRALVAGAAALLAAVFLH